MYQFSLKLIQAFIYWGWLATIPLYAGSEPNTPITSLGTINSKPIIETNSIVATVKSIEIGQQRSLFLEAEKFALAGNLEQVEELKNQLQNYPLLPYLDAVLYSNYPQKFSQQQIESFIQSQPDLTRQTGLLDNWLHSLADKNAWDTFQKYMSPEDALDLQCIYLDHVKINTEQKSFQTWRNQVASIWLTPYSLPSECTPLFNAWKKYGFLTADLVWQRFNAALNNGNSKFAHYLILLLPHKEQYKAQKILGYWKKRGKLPKVKSLLDKKRLSPQLALSLIQRYIWSNPEQASNNYQQLIDILPINSDVIQRTVALSLATSDQPQALNWLQQAELNQSEPVLRHWHLSILLKHHQWNDIEQLLENYLDSGFNHNSYQYWLGRAYLENDKIIKAQKQWKALAQIRDYYGFLASVALDQSVSLNEEKIPMMEQELQQFELIPQIKRATEWFALGRFLEARREWSNYIQKIHGESRLIAAQYAFKIGWYDRAILLLANRPFQNYLFLRFPIPYMKLYKKSKVPASYLMAITRQESIFQIDAYSSTGARGLMQLMPFVAEIQAHKNRLTYYGKQSLYEPETNLSLGSALLDQLLQSFNDDYLLSTAAYNAGSTAVSNWMKTKDELQADIWIETIPYGETRDYIKQVLSYQLIYSIMLEENFSILNSLIKPMFTGKVHNAMGSDTKISDAE
ncbi:MAG: hypothetical protein COW84_10090 [Gammaproteobacteria bacterium CG22_combo_CG10-13_8_21_14_all_40_8]|nr:MAG: hypothetical protein COW84_10090 [Gammaproteobacteria bacterium CG22_combo_CG10-13_8_21_14_all_40_8]